MSCLQKLQGLDALKANNWTINNMCNGTTSGFEVRRRVLMAQNTPNDTMSP